MGNGEFNEMRKCPKYFTAIKFDAEMVIAVFFRGNVMLTP